VRSEIRCVQQFGEPLLYRADVQISRGSQAAAEHEHLRIQQVGEVRQAERDPTAEQIDHVESIDVTLARRRLNVLAADVVGVASGELHDTTKPFSYGRLASYLGQARP
jgi:hypothetical protein